MLEPLRLAALLLAMAALGWSGTAAAQASVAAAEKACTPGADQKEKGEAGDGQPDQYRPSSGRTPPGLQGAVTVSPREARCLMDKLGERLVVVQAMRDSRELPGAVVLPDAASAYEEGRPHQESLQKLAELTGGDKGRPLLVYCHHTSCHLSYNASLRAVRAGYSKVYWLREGNQGWVDAGYPLKGDVLDAQGLPANHAQAVLACDRMHLEYRPRDYASELVRHANAADQQVAFKESMARAREARARCLQQVANARQDNKAVAADIAGRLARNEQEVAQQYQAARDVVEKDPAAVFKRSLDEVDVSRLQVVLERARAAARPVAQACGTLGSATPADKEELAAMRRRLAEHRQCIVGLESANEGSYHAEAFQEIVTRIASIERFTCARNPGPKCVPDAAWRRVAEVINPVNGRIVQAAAERQQARNLELDRAREDTNAWTDRVNEHVARRK